jgi:hypothetical protein
LFIHPNRHSYLLPLSCVSNYCSKCSAVTEDMKVAAYTRIFE